MIEEKYRKEVWSRNKPYMMDSCTTTDLKPCCELCKKNENRVEDQEWCKLKDTCPIFQLWLSNEYLGWVNDTRSIY